MKPTSEAVDLWEFYFLIKYFIIMKTSVKTTIKGKESIFVRESVEVIFDKLNDKSRFIMLTQVAHNDIEKKMGIKKTSIGMFTES